MKKTWKVIWFLQVATAFAMVLVGFLCFGAAFGGCNPCKPGTARCNGSVVEICRPDKRWARVQDCSKLERTTKPFQCCCRIEDSKTKCGCKIQVKK